MINNTSKKYLIEYKIFDKGNPFQIRNNFPIPNNVIITFSIDIILFKSYRTTKTKNINENELLLRTKA